MKRLAIGSALVSSVMAVFVGAAMGGGNGQAVGQDPVRLELTQCSNAGVGNGGEYDVGTFGVVSVKSDCLADSLSKFFGVPYYSEEQIDAILAQANCEGSPLFWVCEIDPGNSAAHNQAQANELPDLVS